MCIYFPLNIKERLRIAGIVCGDVSCRKFWHYEGFPFVSREEENHLYRPSSSERRHESIVVIALLAPVYVWHYIGVEGHMKNLFFVIGLSQKSRSNLGLALHWSSQENVPEHYQTIIRKRFYTKFHSFDSSGSCAYFNRCRSIA